jgi:hypothetical protein
MFGVINTIMFITPCIYVAEFILQSLYKGEVLFRFMDGEIIDLTKTCNAVSQIEKRNG